MNFGIKKLYIDGLLTESANGKYHEVICPADEQNIAQIAWATEADTQKTLEAAQNGFEYWSKLPVEERTEWIDKLRNIIIDNSKLLRESIMYEMGKVWEGTEEDLKSIIDSLKYYSNEIKNRHEISIEDRDGTHKHSIMHQPLGVVVAFLAYNFPLLNLGFKLGPALAAGCSIIIKPSEFSPLSAYILGSLCKEIDFPKGVINIICGDTEEVGIPLCKSTIPKMITMIGSTETAQKLVAQSIDTSIKRFSMECGGNAPFIVFEDADISLAVAHGTALKIGNAGQICVAPNRFYVQESVADKFIQELVGKFENIRLGFGKQNKPEMGPLANKQSVTKIRDIVNEAVKQGGEVLIGGKPYGEVGYYFQPTVIRLEDKNATILQQEIFGPIAIISSFTSIDEVIHMANDTEAGLASYVYSTNEATLALMTENLAFGEVHLNGFKYDIYLPHGGIKNSGIGVDCSTFALDDYLIKKRVTKALN